MSVFGLLNIPIVLLLDNSNYVWAREMMNYLSAASFSGKVYVFSHYINASEKTNFCTAYPAVTWIEAGETMIYEQLCSDGNVTPARVTFYLLPELLQESRVVVWQRPMDEHALRKMLNQIRWWEKTCAPFVETKEYAYLDLDLLRQTGLFNQFIEGE